MKKLRIFQTELRVYEMLLYGIRKQKKKYSPIHIIKNLRISTIYAITTWTLNKFGEFTKHLTNAVILMFSVVLF